MPSETTRACKPVVFAAVLIVLVGAAGATVPEQRGGRFEAAVETYRLAIASANQQTTPRAIENAYVALSAVREAFSEPDSTRTRLESMTDAEFAEFRDSLPGASISRSELLYLRPDIPYFRDLAARGGDAADRDFFAALGATYPDSRWPVYLRQQTDSTGCTRFGTMSLVETYGAWIEFGRRHPGRYGVPAAAEADAVIRQLTATCACDDAPGVEAELQAFIESFPASPARDGIEATLDSVRDGSSEIRTHCISG